jgi:hypothetical protein
MISVWTLNQELTPQRGRRNYFESNEESAQVAKIQAENSHAVEFMQSQFLIGTYGDYFI